MEDKSFYVYALLDSRQPGYFVYEVNGNKISFNYEPFYIGKGGATSKSRPLDHFNECKEKSHNLLKSGIINKIKNLKLEEKYEFVFENLNEDDAFTYEKLLIKTIGRRDLALGPLSNMTDGGEGMSGFIYSNEQKKIRSERFLGKSYEERYGSKEKADLVKQKLSEGKLGSKHVNYGKTYVELYGEEKAKEIRESKRQKVSGSGNGMYGKHCSDELKEKNRIRHLRENLSKEELEARSRAGKGRFWLTNGIEEIFIFPSDSKKYFELGWVKGRKPVTEETRALNSKNQKGRPKRKHTEEEKDAARQRALNRYRLVCPFCKKEVDYVNFARWHGDKCKNCKNGGGI